MNKISVLGCGRWGSFIAWYLATKKGKEVYSWGPEDDYSYKVLKETGKNEYVTLDKSITLTCDLQRAVERAEIIIISISSQGLRGFIRRIQKCADVSDKIFVLCMKGIEVETGERLSEILIGEGVSPEKIAVWVGPGHIQDFTAGIPNCMVIDSHGVSLKKALADDFKSDLIRFYYGNDIIGTEIMSRGAREVARLIKALGGSELSAYGLAHLGDYETTLFSRHSHNRMYGEMLVKGQKFEKLAEGVMTAAAMKKLGEKYGVELPITDAVYDVCFAEHPQSVEEWKKLCMDRISQLFSRDTKFEF